MKKMSMSGVYRCGLLVLASGAVLLAGCGMTSTGSFSSAPATSAVALTGSVHGGQQPVSGATIQLYAASTNGYGAASYALLNTTVLTTASGGFTITADYICPSSSSQVYLTATGGNSGSGTNANLAEMAALGPCGSLGPTTFISVNELTTVASVWALAPFMTSINAVGTSSTNVTGLANAFAAVSKLTTIATGAIPGNTLPTGATIPVNEMNTLADVLAACVNTSGGTGTCTSLFAAATPAGGTAPTDTIGAALNIAKNPSLNVSTLYNLTAASAPFQPTLSAAPSDWTISVTYSGSGFSKPSAAAVDGSGSLWVTNSTGNSVTVLTSSGAPQAGSPFTGSGLSGPSAIAIDASGGAWITNKTTSTVTALTATGTGISGTPFSGGGLSSPTGVSIDGQGYIWVTNSGNSSVTKLSASGGALSGFGYTGAGITSPVAIAINPQ